MIRRRPPQRALRSSRNSESRGAPAPSISSEDYLERIGELMEREGRARVADIADQLQVSRPSVTAMVQRLAEAGYLEYEKYRGLLLTAQGREVAQRIKDRHATLSRFLSLLDLDEATQENDIEGLEHCLSPVTLERLARLSDFLEARPGLLKEFHQSTR